MPLTVRFRPNSAYLWFLAVGVVVIVIGVITGGVFGVVLIACGGFLAVILGYPAVASTVLRVPVVVIDAHGIRLPMMGVRLDWSEIVDVRPTFRMRTQPAGSRRAVSGGTQIPVLLVVPADADATVRQVHWWLRADARRELATLGSPIVLDDRSLDHTLTEIGAAVSAHRPAR